MDDILKRLCAYLDKQLWDRKVSDTNWNYNGLILDYFFDNAVLSIDFLNIEDYFNDKGITYYEERTLEDQVDQLSQEKTIVFIEAVLNILKFSKYNEEWSGEVLKKSEAYLVRNGFVVNDTSTNVIEVSLNNEIGRGAYCRVLKYAPSIVKKELLLQHRNDEKLKKRLKYEFENTQKLAGCPNIIRAYEFNVDDWSYLLEEADANLLDYLSGQVGLSREERLKIIMDILNGMKYAHDNDIIHRDLHLGNILKIGDAFVISDFGWSKDISIERSLKSSTTEKNNHYFMDPLAAGDLTKMDKQTDIYSIGKIMEYIYSYENDDKMLDFIVAKCTARDKKNRYHSVDDILVELQSILHDENEEQQRQIINANIKRGVLTSKEEQYIRKLVANDELCNYIVRYKLSNFGSVILKLPELEREEVLKNIEEGYAESTGYNGFSNYDIYGDIAYHVHMNTKDMRIKQISKSILEGCAGYRWKVQALLEKINASEL